MAPKKVASGASESKNALFLSGLVTSSGVYPDAGVSGTDQNRPRAAQRWLKLFCCLGVCLLRISCQPSPPTPTPLPSSGLFFPVPIVESPRACIWSWKGKIAQEQGLGFQSGSSFTSCMTFGK